MATELILKSNEFQWIDITNPSVDELNQIAKEHSIHPNIIHDCLDAEHLPKFEIIGNHFFMILRTFDDECSSDADTIQELTRKIAFFYSNSILITIHRKEQAYLSNIKNHYSKITEIKADAANKILFDIMKAALETYNKPIDAALNQLENLEMGVFGARGTKNFEIEDGYYLKRKAWVFKRMLHMTLDFIPKIGTGSHLQNLKEIAESNFYYVDDLVESINSLLNLYISLSSHKTNEVVRVLTIISVFLLPLNLITGIYGMNFEFMPELKLKLGYPAALLLMGFITITVFLWFRKKGWLR